MDDADYLASSAKIINAELVKKTPLPNDIDKVMVFIRNGYDIGIWRNYVNADFSFLKQEFNNNGPRIRLRTTRGKSQISR